MVNFSKPGVVSSSIASRAPDDQGETGDSGAFPHPNRLVRSRGPASSNKLADFLGSLPCVIYESAADLTVTSISSNVFDLIGVQRAHLQGNRALWHERLPQEDCKRLTTRLNLLSGTEIASESHRIINDLGMPVWVSHSFRKIVQNNEASIRGCIIPLRLDARAGTLDSGVISQFVHKIGNHFQLINLLIGSLKRNGTSIEEIEALQETVDRAVEFTRSFSHYSQTPVCSSTVDLCEILRSVIYSHVPLFLEKKVAFKPVIHESLDGALIPGDAYLLEHALTSILQNALDATRGGDQVMIDARKESITSTSRSLACICIVDSGCGMDKGTLARASAPFFSSKPERNGLGLSTAIRILEMHGGTLDISSDEKQGTRISISLPVSDSTSHAER